MRCLPYLLIIVGVLGCGRSDETAWDKIIYSCGPGVPCPIYIKNGHEYFKDTDGTFKPL